MQQLIYDLLVCVFESLFKGKFQLLSLFELDQVYHLEVKSWLSVPYQRGFSLNENCPLCFSVLKTAVPSSNYGSVFPMLKDLDLLYHVALLSI